VTGAESVVPVSKRLMRRPTLIAIALAVTAGACAPKKPIAASPDVKARERLAAADRNLLAGCYDCLVAAFREYDALRQLPVTADAAAAGAVRAAALVALRERELGMIDSGHLARARGLLAAGPAIPSWLARIVDIVDATSFASIGAGHPTTDADLERGRVMRANYEAWTAGTREAAVYDEAAAYAYLSLTCNAGEMRSLTKDQLLEPTETFEDAPLIVYRAALCRGADGAKLKALLDADPRFIEVTFYLGGLETSAQGRPGVIRLGGQALDAAVEWYQRGYAWHPQWPTLAITMANLNMTAEEFEAALKLFDDTLTYDPAAVDALLGRVKALTYLGKNEEGIAGADRLLPLGWYVGDARYWRALNETQLERYDEAWVDVELADKLLKNASVPKLAGIIAYRRKDLDVARTKFDLSRSRDPHDCETGYYLGTVLAEQREWPRTSEVLKDTASCLQDAIVDLQRQIAEIQTSRDKPDRIAKQVAKRERQIVESRRELVQSTFNVAVASFNLARKDDAREWAEKVVDDETFGPRARDLISRLR
jgi:tetratricopeptide (TPR) repeat protein